jgi:hypothetical protein
MKTHDSSFALHVIAGTLVAAVLMTAATAVAAGEPVSSKAFAAGWQDHARPLFFKSFGATPGTSIWFVPRIMPRGRYVLIQREGDKAELIPGYQFEVNSDIFRDINVWVPANYRNVEALPIGDVPGTLPLRGDGFHPL